MKRIRTVSALAALAVVVALAIVSTRSKHTVPTVYAASGCSNATLNGNYALMQPAGFIAPGGSTTGSEVPWQFVGVANFDGQPQGHIQVVYTAVVNGAISGKDLQSTPQTGVGVYTVSSEPNFLEPISELPCTGSISLRSGDAAGITANIVIVGGGAEVFGIITNTGGITSSTNAGGTASFHLKKQ